MIPSVHPRSSDSAQTDRDLLVGELRKNLKGDVFDSHADRLRYATDESIFSLTPQVVVAPKGEADVQATVAIAQFFSVPITARGGGTSIAGQSIGSGIILDFRQQMQKILEISKDGAVVQPGVMLSALNAKLAKYGRRFAPDPGSKANCTLGGMVATNASGPHSYLHGDTRQHVEKLRIVLADGAAMDSDQLSRRFPTFHVQIAKEKELIHNSRPRTRKNSSGYALEELCKEPPNYAHFLVGSEGTLTLTTEIEVRTIPLPATTTLAIIPYSSLIEAIKDLDRMRGFHPAAIELVDRTILQALHRANSTILTAVGLDNANASLWVEWEGSLPVEIAWENCFLIEDPAGLSSIWALRSRASKYIHEQATQRKPLRCIEDCAVPPDRLVHYVEALQEILKEHDCEGAIFGHAGDGHLHVNPYIDIRAPKLPQRIERLMEDVYSLVIRLGGTVTGEHGDGILRRKFVERQWAPLLSLFQLVKEVFDPAGIFNPDKKYSLMPTLMPPYRDFKTAYEPTRSQLPAPDIELPLPR